MADAKTMLEFLSEPFPPIAIEKRQGAHGKMLDYVATETVIRRLNKVAMQWDFRITDKHIKDDLLVIWGELTIPGLGTRTGTGVQKLQGGEDMWKGAASDALKKAATQFGVGIDLYGPDLEAGELPNEPKSPPRARSTSVGTIPREADVPANLPDPVNWTEFWNRAKVYSLKDKGEFESKVGTALPSNVAFAWEKVQAWAKDNASQRNLIS